MQNLKDRPSYWKQGDPVPEKVIRTEEFTVYIMPPRQQATQADLDKLHFTLARLLRKSSKAG